MPKHGVSCVTCHRRGRKCDKEFPSCRACADRGVLCEGYALRWHDPVTSASLATGQVSSGRRSSSRNETTKSSRPAEHRGVSSGSTEAKPSLPPYAGPQPTFTASNDEHAANLQRPSSISAVLINDGLDELVDFCDSLCASVCTSLTLVQMLAKLLPSSTTTLIQPRIHILKLFSHWPRLLPRYVMLLQPQVPATWQP